MYVARELERPAWFGECRAADTVDVAARGAVVDLHRDAVHALATGAAAQLRRADARDIGDSLCQGARVRQRPRDGSQVRAVDWMFRAARWLVLASRTSSSRRVRCIACVLPLTTRWSRFNG